MTMNVGGFDRILRILLGIALIAAPFVWAAWADILWLAWGLPAVGVILVATGAFGACPIYGVLGLSTCGRT